MKSARIPLKLEFSPRRAWLLVRNSLLFQYRTLGIAAGSFAAVYLVVYLLSGIGTDQASGLASGFFIAGLSLALYVGASLSFAEIHRHHRAQAWFMLPASTLEKFLVNWVLVSFGVLAASLVGFSLLDLAARGISTLIFGHGQAGFSPFDPTLWTYIGVALATQPIFIYGSVRFKRLALLKTVFALFGFSLLLGAVSTGIAWLALLPYSLGGTGFGFHGDGEQVSLVFGDAGYLVVLCQILLYGVLPLFFLVAAWLRLGESEVHDGIR